MSDATYSDVGPPLLEERPENPTLEDLVLTFLMYAATGKREYFWAVDFQLSLVFTRRWPDLWHLIRALVAGADTTDCDVFDFIAAGPLETLLVQAGPDYIGEVEREAQESPRFRRVLTGVWQNSMAESVWARVRVACAEPLSPERP